MVLVRLKALVVVGDGLEDYGDLLANERAGDKHMLGIRETVNVKDILYSAKCGVHIIVLRLRKRLWQTRQRRESEDEGVAGLGWKPNP